MLEQEFEKMLKDLNSMNDDFINGYFNDDIEENEEILDTNEDKISFSLDDMNSLSEEKSSDLVLKNEIELKEYEKVENVENDISEETIANEEINVPIESKEELEFVMPDDNSLESSEELELEAVTIDSILSDGIDSLTETKKYLEQENEENLSKFQNSNVEDKQENHETDEEKEEKKEDIEKTRYSKDIDDFYNEEKKEIVYQNRFTSFSKKNLNKINTKKIKVDRKAKFNNDKRQEEKKSFSYNDILDRLDSNRKLDINNVNDLMKIIDKCNNSNDFFEYVESEFNDK